MRVPLWRWLPIAPVLSVALIAAGQAQAPAHKSSATKRYCHPELNFCLQYPSAWTVVGKVFNSNGIVVAPPQKQDEALWDTVTIALVVVAPEGDEEPMGLNGVIEQASTGLREDGQNFETLQRQELTVDHKPAQLLKVSYRDKSTDRVWIEELVFIEGQDGEIYSVALKCAPQNLTRLEPALKSILASWTLPKAAPPPPPAAEEDSPKAPSKAEPPN